MARTSSKGKYIDEVKRLYIDELHSLSEISKILGPSVQTLSRWLGEEGIELAARPRDPNAGRSTAGQAAINERIAAAQRARLSAGGHHGGRHQVIEREERDCANPGCDAVFIAAVTSGQEFCGRTCARIVGNKERWAGKKKETTCPCGEVFYSPHPKKYHSDECRDKYGKKRQPDPVNTIGATCQNPDCLRPDRKFSYPKSQGHRKYCSDKCSQQHVRPAEQLNGLEGMFYNLTNFLGLGCRRPEGSEQIPFGIRGSYAPDFIVTWQGETLWAETKGDRWVKGDTAAKHAAWRAQRGRLVLVFEEDLNELRVLPSAQAYWDALKIRAIEQEAG